MTLRTLALHFGACAAALSLAAGCAAGAPSGPFDPGPAPAPPSDEASGFGGSASGHAPELAVTSIRRTSGDIVEIRGTGFGAPGSVTIGGHPVPFVSWSDHLVTIATPQIADGRYPVVLASSGEESNAVMWTAETVATCPARGAGDDDGEAPAAADDDARAAVPTYVSVTFDDGFDAQASPGLLALLARLDMRATFFVNSGMLGAGSSDGRDDHFDEAALARIAAAGHEIGGHTLDHVDLLSASPDEARRQICDDRAELVRLGYAPVTFAYPFGHGSETLRAIVQGCGYQGARVASAPAGTIWPSSTYEMRSAPAFTCTDTLEAMKDRIRQVERTGGYTAIAFHDVCDRDCTLYSTPAARLTSFLEWLKTRESRGTYVRAIGDVVTGGQRPATGPEQPR
jgi:peptidoglycan/xylan/chitin deacetylase (PgdA/CDA1 family)